MGKLIEDKKHGGVNGAGSVVNRVVHSALPLSRNTSPLLLSRMLDITELVTRTFPGHSTPERHSP